MSATLQDYFENVRYYDDIYTPEGKSLGYTIGQANPTGKMYAARAITVHQGDAIMVDKAHQGAELLRFKRTQKIMLVSRASMGRAKL